MKSINIRKISEYWTAIVCIGVAGGLSIISAVFFGGNLGTHGRYIILSLLVIAGFQYNLACITASKRAEERIKMLEEEIDELKKRMPMVGDSASSVE